MSAPQSIIYVCSGVKLDNRYLHTYYWETAAAQLSHFQSKVVRTFTHYTYLRKRWDIKLDASFDEAREWDYLYFTNGSKYWFYFITDVEYISPSTVRLILELDVMQSYALDYTLLPAYVERQHVEDDTIGKHTVEEGLEIGELQTAGISHVPLADLCLLVQSTFDPILTTDSENMTKVLYGKYDGVYSGLGIYAVDMTNLAAWGNKLLLLDEAGISDGIVNMWMFPKALVNLVDNDGWGNGNVTHRVVGIEPFFVDRSRPSTIGGYVPRNNKLFTYPYTLLHVTNNAGNAAEFRWEFFSDPNECKFKVTGALGADGGARLYPMNYNAEPQAYEHGLTLSNFPSCAWNQDVYKLWLAQNQNQIATSIGQAAITTAVGVGAAVATGGLGGLAAGGAALSGVNTIASQLAAIKDKSVEPPQAKGRSSSSINISAGFQTFTLKAMRVSLERAKIIDDYFTMYGYKIQRVQTPNRCARENFTFVKTVGGCVSGDFCDRDRVQIGEILDKGITFWRQPANICNYSVSNKPL